MGYVSGRYVFQFCEQCTRLLCEAFDGFEKTYVSHTAVASCPVGYSGERIALCNSDLTFLEQSNTCSKIKCAYSPYTTSDFYVGDPAQIIDCYPLLGTSGKATFECQLIDSDFQLAQVIEVIDSFWSISKIDCILR